MIPYLFLEAHLMLDLSDDLRMDEVVPAPRLLNALHQRVADQPLHYFLPPAALLTSMGEDFLHHLSL